MRKWLARVGYTAVVYLFVYGPPFTVLPVNVSSMVAVPVVLGWMLRERGRLEWRRVRFNWETRLLLLILVYSGFLAAVSQDLTMLAAVAVLVCINVPTAYALVRLSLNLREYVVGAIVNAAVVAAAGSVWLALNPEINFALKFSILKYDSSLMEHQLFRGFGVSDELLFSFSIVQAIGLYLCLVEPYSWFRKAVVCILLIVSIALNAKIGLLLAIAAFIFAAFHRNWSSAQLGLLLIALWVLLLIALSVPELEAVWSIQQASLEGEFAGGGGGESSLRILLDEMLFLPDNVVVMLFGDGSYLFGRGVKGSDSGWVLLLHYGGLVIVVSVIVLLFVCVRRLSRVGFLGLGLFLMVVFAIANTKGLFFAPKPGFRVMVLLYFHSVLSPCLRVRKGTAVA